MIRALVVEDEPASQARICELLSEFAGVEIVGTSANGLTAVEMIVEHRPDLVLLDIELPELDGFEVLESLPTDQRPAVVFITAYDEFAIRAFEENAIDYVLKPFGAARFTRAVTRALERLRATGYDQTVQPAFDAAAALRQRKFLRRFAARSLNKVYFIAVDTVDWIDSADNYLRLHVGGREHLVRGTITAVLERLDPEQFVRVNRGIVVRVDAVVSIEHVAPATFRLVMTDGARLSSSRTHAVSVRGLMTP